MSDYPMLISNKLHSFRNFVAQSYIPLNQTDSRTLSNAYNHSALYERE